MNSDATPSRGLCLLFIHPRAPNLSCVQQGPFAPRALPRFNATTDPAATVSSSTVFPGPPVMRSTLLRRFLDGTRTASPVAWHVLVTVLSLPPRHRDVPHQILWRHILLPLSDTRKLGLWGLFFCRGHLWVHLCYGPVTRSPSSRWLCQSASSVSFPPERDDGFRRAFSRSSSLSFGSSAFAFRPRPVPKLGCPFHKLRSAPRRHRQGWRPDLTTSHFRGKTDTKLETIWLKPALPRRFQPALVSTE